MWSNQKIFSVFVVILIIIIAIIALVLHKKAANNTTPSGFVPTPVKLTVVTKHNIPMQVQAIGTVIAPETVMLKAQQAGRVLGIYFHPGEQVKKGQALLQIDPAAFKAQVDEEKASYLQLASAYNRYKLLQASDTKDGDLNAVSPEVLQEKHSAAQVAYAKLQAAQYALTQTKIVAPFSGVVGSLESLQIGNSNNSNLSGSVQQAEISLGSYLSVGDNVVLITNPRDIVVQYPVAQRYSRYIKIGQSVRLKTTAYPKQTFTGYVTYISPVVSSTGYVYKIRAKIDNSKRLLKSGMHVMVSQVLQAHREVLAIPSISLMPDFNGYQVYTVINNKVNGVPVRIGQRYNTWIEIKSGLKAGQKIMVEGQSKVNPGEPVKVIN